MPGRDIPDSVRRLVLERIDSVPELEAVLLLLGAAGRTWTGEEAGARLYVSVAVATHVLDRLTARGLVKLTDGRYRYVPASPELDEAVAMLARAYASNLIAVTQLIHGKPGASILQFADAFRLRQED